MELESARSIVAEAGRILAHQGLIDYLGHVSIRVGDHVVIKPKHSPTVRSSLFLSAGDMVVVDLDGRLVSGEAPPPSEVFIHTEVYRAREDVRAVVHTHQRFATLMGVMEQPMRPILHIPASYVDHVALWPHANLVSDAVLGKDLAATLGDSRFCHLQGHGVISVSATMQESVVNAVMLEELAQANVTALQCGATTRAIPDEELVELRRLRGGVEGRWQYLRQVAGV
jgi:ribulose-5-phosphate 4-epimerase/fuculose-1-phosphate aldolase